MNSILLNAPRSISLLLLCLLLTSCAAPPVRPQYFPPGDYGYVKDYGSWLIRREMAKNNVQGLSIALVDDQKVVWAEGFGFADTKAGRPATADTIYRVGSVSKLFTVTAALQLAERGLISLDQPLSQYIPDFSLKTHSADAPPITVRSVMTHHSGIPSDYMKGMWSKGVHPFSELPAELRDDYAAFPPYTVFSYSNVGMSLLGLAVQNVSGMKFSDYMRQSVLEPLGMKDAYFSPSLADSPQSSRAYSGRDEKQEPALRDVPAGGLNASAPDLGRFIEMVLAGGELDGHRVLRPESVHEMLSPQNSRIPLDLDFRIGLGWMLGGLGRIDIKNAGPVVHHNGATFYHRAEVIVLPESKLGVVVLSNTATKQKVVDIIAVEVIKTALEVKSGARQPERKPVETGPFLSGDELRSYTGYYATVAGLTKITADGDHLTARLMNSSLRLTPRADGRLQAKYLLFGFIPVGLGDRSDYGFERKNVYGHDILAAVSGDKEMLVGERVTPIPIASSWRRRLGSYRIVNPGDDVPLLKSMTLRESDGLLLVDYTMSEFSDATITVVLRPLSDKEAVLYGLWRGMGETVRVIDGPGGELLRYSGYDFKKIGNE